MYTQVIERESLGSWMRKYIYSQVIEREFLGSWMRKYLFNQVIDQKVNIYALTIY
jgi:hypothetical protein